MAGKKEELMLQVFFEESLEEMLPKTDGEMFIALAAFIVAQSIVEMVQKTLTDLEYLLEEEEVVVYKKKISYLAEREQALRRYIERQHDWGGKTKRKKQFIQWYQEQMNCYREQESEWYERIKSLCEKILQRTEQAVGST